MLQENRSRETLAVASKMAKKQFTSAKHFHQETENCHLHKGWTYYYSVTSASISARCAT